MSRSKLPTIEELALPTLHTLEKCGGSASNAEIAKDLASNLRLSEAALNSLHGSGPQTELGYRAAWTRTCLGGIDFVETNGRGVWSMKEAGRKFLADESHSPEAEKSLKSRISEYRYRRSSGKKPRPSARPSMGDSSDDETPKWKEDLLEKIRSMEPDAFERLCQRMLREHDFTEVVVTGRSGDQGVDGKGVLRLGLVSFQVVFQCKRYQGQVPPKEIRDFRGAMAGRGDKGLFFTTGSFTAAAKTVALAWSNR